MSTSKTLIAADELLRISAKGRYELIRGELVEMAPAGARHGDIAMLIGWRLSEYVMGNRLGKVFAAETGFRLACDPDTVRAPDVAFVSKDHLPPGELPTGYLDVAPDLVVEVVSPSDAAGDVQAKVEDWLRAGTRLVWVVYPDTQTVTAYRALDDVRVLTEKHAMSGEPILPDFSLAVIEVF